MVEVQSGQISKWSKSKVVKVQSGAPLRLLEGGARGERVRVRLRQRRHLTRVFECHLAECINRMVLKSQLPHKSVNLLF